MLLQYSKLQFLFTQPTLASLACNAFFRISLLIWEMYTVRKIIAVIYKITAKNWTIAAGICAHYIKDNKQILKSSQH